MSLNSNRGFLLRAQRFLVGTSVIYLGIVALLATPFFQRHALYMHAARWPLFASYDLPEKYGLAPFKVVNTNISASDGVTLGAWFVYSESYYQTHAVDSLDVHSALSSHPTIIFFHGNAATRCVSFRVQQYMAFSSRLGANVFAIDYRGFGDSEGVPSEDGLTKDARAAWEWVKARGARSQDVLLVGISLGTGVVANLAGQLAQEGIEPKGVVLLAPFSSITTLLPTYNLFGIFPLLKPLELYPFARNLLFKFLQHRFDTLSILPTIHAPILLVHAENDFDIVYTHSESLFEALLEPLLPAVDPLPAQQATSSKEEWNAFRLALAERQLLKDALVTTRELYRFGSTSEFQRGGESGRVMFLKTKWGGHDRVGLAEGVQDVIRDFFEIKAHI